MLVALAKPGYSLSSSGRSEREGSGSDKGKLIVVTGAGGFIGGHLVGELKRLGFDSIRGVDIKPDHRWYQRHDGVENITADLRESDACQRAVAGAVNVFNLAADMGGMGFIETTRPTAWSPYSSTPTY
jgi:GDP-D-mannose 3', 5'-epimerase